MGFTLPVIFLISVILGLLVNNFYYLILILINAMGISWISVPLSLYLTVLQRTSGSTRAPLGTYIGLMIYFIYIFSTTYIKTTTEILDLLLYVGVGLLTLAIVLTILLGNLVRTEKLLP